MGSDEIISRRIFLLSNPHFLTRKWKIEQENISIRGPSLIIVEYCKFHFRIFHFKTMRLNFHPISDAISCADSLSGRILMEE